MSGLTDLNQLLQNLDPVLNSGIYVFCFLPQSRFPEGLDPVATFQENEGLTLILPKEVAIKFHLEYESEFSWITLNVHSSLQAIGLTAAVSKVLAESNISCNVVSAFHHDHIFVEVSKGKLALGMLKGLNQKA